MSIEKDQVGGDIDFSDGELSEMGVELAGRDVSAPQTRRSRSMVRVPVDEVPRPQGTTEPRAATTTDPSLPAIAALATADPADDVVEHAFANGGVAEGVISAEVRLAGAPAKDEIEAFTAGLIADRVFEMDMELAEEADTDPKALAQLRAEEAAVAGVIPQRMEDAPTRQLGLPVASPRPLNPALAALARAVATPGEAGDWLKPGQTTSAATADGVAPDAARSRKVSPPRGTTPNEARAAAVAAVVKAPAAEAVRDDEDAEMVLDDAEMEDVGAELEEAEPLAPPFQAERQRAQTPLSPPPAPDDTEALAVEPGAGVLSEEDAAVAAVVAAAEAIPSLSPAPPPSAPTASTPPAPPAAATAAPAPTTTAPSLPAAPPPVPVPPSPPPARPEPPAAARAAPAAGAATPPPAPTGASAATPPPPPAPAAGASPPPAPPGAVASPPPAPASAPAPPSAPPPAPQGAPAAPAATPPAAPVAAALPAPEMPLRPRRKRRAKQWFEEVFDDDYLRTLPFLTPRQTEREAQFVAESLQIPAGGALLDLACGYGRHAMELAARSYKVTGLDLSLPLLIRAADAARRVGVNVNFIHGDMREMTFEDEFDGAYCMFTSFGYFDDDTNRKVAANLARAIKPGGRLLVDVVNRDYVVGDLPTRVWWQGDGCVVLEEVDFNYFSSRVQVQRSIIFEDGRQVEQEISIRAYSLHEIGKVLHHSGFRVTEVSGGLSLRGKFFGANSRQLIVVAEKKVTP